MSRVLLVAVSLVLLSVGMAGASPPVSPALAQGTAIVPAPASHPGWVAHSAYGIQVSIPNSWKVRYFSPCPRTDTLNIGAADYGLNCPNDGGGSWVEIDATLPDVSPPTGNVVFRVNRLRVAPQSALGVRDWFVLSKRVYVSGSGPKALDVMRTLSVASRRAISAPSIVTGHEYLEAVMQVPVSGSVTLTTLKSHKTRTLDTIDGTWWAMLSPGLYAATGHDGDAVCSPVKFAVPSGLRVAGPTIRCQGM
jgi:hypothetical protein